MGSGGVSSSANESRPQLTPRSMLDLYNRALPVSLSTVMNQVPSSVNTLANAANINNPLYTAGTLQQIGDYAGGYQRAGADLAQAQANSTANLLGGAGGNAALSAAALNSALNPVQAASNQQAQNLLNSYNLGGLSPGQQNAVERGLNQNLQGTGNLGLVNPTNTISNAMNFGNEYKQQQAGLSNALGTATNVANAQNAQFNPVNVAIGAGNTSSNFGLGQFNPNQANSLVNIPVNAATGWGTQLAGIASSGTSAGKSESAQGGMSCCFIVMECYNGNMPSFVRKCRDRYYTNAPEIAVGYKRMAKWLVPMMRSNVIVRSAVWHLMVKPLTEYGSFIINRTERKGRWARTFWFSVWRKLGKV